MRIAVNEVARIEHSYLLWINDTLWGSSYQTASQTIVRVLLGTTVDGEGSAIPCSDVKETAHDHTKAQAAVRH